MNARPGPMTIPRALLVALVLLGATASVRAVQSDPPPPPPPSDTPAQPAKDEPAGTPGDADGAEKEGQGDEEKSEEGLPGLDELLGLPSNDRPADEESRTLFEELDPSKVELERKLTAQEAADQLASAVQQMEETAFRIEKIRDTGIVTQRLQSEIITKLDVLIKQAESAASSSGSSSSSSQSQPSQMKPGDQQAQAAQSNQQNSNQHTGPQSPGGLPGFQQNPGDQFDAATAAWGALPERIREKLLEGTTDTFSEFYRALTEAYYKRLAEEASQ